MMKKYYKNLDLIRVFACLAILLYHIGLLKGGYLAVCTFFVMTGYLSITSIFKKEKFSLKEYYINKFKRIYLPLLVVVFISIAIISFIPSIHYMNLKPEATSVLLGYNNYWQLNAHLDYFVRHISSPFMHLWYIAILLQFELIFPFIYISIRKLRKKFYRWVPCILLMIIGAFSYLFFCKVISDGNLMNAYYGTFTRVFSIIFGLLLGLIHIYYKPIVLKGIIHKYIFIFYLLLLTFIFCTVDFKSNYFVISMLITTLITMRLIDYATLFIKEKNKFDKVISSLSKISYEVYLVQYPVIYFIQILNINGLLKVILSFCLSIIVGYVINKSLNIRVNNRIKTIRFILVIPIFILTIYGGYKYVVAKDYTNDMKKLQSDLRKNRKLIEQKKKEYKLREKKEQEEWETLFNELDSDAEKLKDRVKDLHIVGVGDSVMEMAAKSLYKKFPNGYFDAEVSRNERKAIDVINDLKSKNNLGDYLIINIGINGDCETKIKDKLAQAVDGKTTFWVNATKADCASFNNDLKTVVDKYDNIHLIDWYSITKEHPEYIAPDKIHPSVKGCSVYADTIYNAIYQEYVKDIRIKKEEKQKEREEKENKKITFVGDELLIGLYDYMSDEYSNSDTVIDKKFTYKTLKETLEEKIQNNSLSHNVVFAFSNKTKLTKKQYEEIINICKDHNIYIVDINNKLKISDKAHIIKFKLKAKYTAPDGIHLSNKGNKKLKEVLDKKLNEKTT